MEAPPVTGDRFFVVTDDDRRGVLWVVSTICCIYIVMIFALRASARRGSYGLDDWTAVIATVFGVLQSIMIYVATAHGMGRNFDQISSSDANTIGKMIIASNALVVITLLFSKCSVIYLCRRLFVGNMRSRLVVCDILAGLCAVWCVGSAIALGLGCGPLQQIGYRTGFCSSLITRWKVVGIIDRATELLVIGLACFVVQPLKMRTARKLLVLCSFASRFLLIPFITLHITKLSNTTHKTSSRGASFTTPTVYLQIQVLYAVFSAAIPPLNRWLRKFDTSMGGAWQASSNYGSAHDSRSRAVTGHTVKNGSYKLQSINSATKSQSASQLWSGNSTDDFVKLQKPSITANWRPEHLGYRADIISQRAVDMDAQSGQSQASVNSEAKIIRKDTHWKVHYEMNSDARGVRQRDSDGTETSGLADS